MKKFLLLVGAVTAFLAGYGVSDSFAAYPSGGMYGRGEHNGFFTNINDNSGSPVLRQVYDGESIRPDVNDAASFISFIKYTKLDIDNNGSGDARDKTGAAFIIHTMLGSGTSSRGRPPSAAQIAEWEKRVHYLDAHNKVSWRVNYTFNINSYWQATDGGGSNPNDAAFYDEPGGNQTKPSIVFRNMNNSIIYAIKWECANPVGNVSALPPTPEFNMWGGTTVSDSTPIPGDTITFRHHLYNMGPDATNPDTISWRVYQGATQRSSGNAGTFAASGAAGHREDNIGVENYFIPTNTAPGTTICRNIWFSPDTHLGGSQEANEVCAVVQYNYSLTPAINVTVNGGAPSGGTAEAGDSITFTYVVNNTGTTASQTVNCNLYRVVRDGSYTAPNPPDGANNPAGYAPPGIGCPRTFPTGATTLNPGGETITNVTANKTYCQSFFIDPVAQGGGRVGTQSCIRVVAKPYLKVYGGDVSVGGGVESAPYTCAANNNGSAVSWNRGSSPYQGAGVQYAAFVLGRLLYFPTAQSAGSSASAPIALSFANTGSGITNTGSGLYGGSSGSVPCIQDYYASLPSASTTLGTSTNASSLVTGNYSRVGNLTITGGQVNPGQRMTIYVDGDVNITGSITYPGTWTYNNIPMFRLIVRGNIYIAPGVGALDGLYVAQNTTSSNGTIYTCAPGGVPPTLGASLYNDCDDNKLVVNGSFVARNVELLRTRGSLAQSSTDGGPGSTNAAEEFNYNPAFWIAQPNIVEGANSYDAITSLPPVL
jgi:hypothetical protein